MLCNAQIFLYFLELACVNQGRRILLSVYGILLKAREQLVESHRSRAGAKCVEEINKYLILHNSHLKSLQIFRFCNRTYVVRHTSESVVGITKAVDSYGLQFLVKVTAHVSVHRFKCILSVAEQPWHIHYTEIRRICH